MTIVRNVTGKVHHFDKVFLCPRFIEFDWQIYGDDGEDVQVDVQVEFDDADNLRIRDVSTPYGVPMPYSPEEESEILAAARDVLPAVRKEAFLDELVTEYRAKTYGWDKGEEA